ncbi:MAG: hypothetical protein MUC28_00865, partial [Planctomycetes bacterium]|nr:hypothetical protein [Planctomycetota bacterium]
MNLNDVKKIKTLDSGRVAESIELLPDQIRQVLIDVRLVKIPRDYAKITNVVVNGMGGSNLGARMIKHLWGDQIKQPISITPGYQVPAFVGRDTLYIISTYSGTTEESLSVYKEIKKRGAKITGITCHGPKNALEKLMIKDNIPGYVFTPEYNPSAQPRLGLGYSVFGMAAIMAKVGLFKLITREIEDIIASMEIWSRRLRPEEAIKSNVAKQLALALFNRTPILVGAEFLSGNLHIIRNQLNESSKLFSSYLALPDLNHYAMEGLKNPASNQRTLSFLFIDSKLYHPRVQKRARLTKEIVKKNGIPVVSCELKGTNPVAQACELLQLGSWLSFYLGMLYNVDPV